MKFILNSFIILAILPPVPFLITYFIHFYVKNKKKDAIRMAMDVTTVFLILIVAALFNNIFSSTFGFYLILLILLVSGGLIGGAQNRMKGRVDVKRLLRAVWRLTFIGSVLAYFLFVIIGFFPYIFTS